MENSWTEDISRLSWQEAPSRSRVVKLSEPGMNEAKITDGYDDAKTIFVKNLPYDTTEQEVNDYFLKCGAIQSVRLVYNSLHNHFKGFGYVDFKNSSAVKEAVKLDGKIFKGRALTIDIETSKPKEGYKFRGTEDNRKFYRTYGLSDSGMRRNESTVVSLPTKPKSPLRTMSLTTTNLTELLPWPSVREDWDHLSPTFGLKLAI